MTTSTNFLGIPVEGDIMRHTRSRAKQLTIEEFRPLLEAVLADERLEALRWHQYTPYFNDGDPCEFSVGELMVRVPGMSEEAGDYEDGFEDIGYPYDPALIALIGEKKYSSDYSSRWYEGGSAPELREAIQKLNSVWSGCEEIMLAAFGDHAEVTVRRDGITVEEYSHD